MTHELWMLQHFNTVKWYESESSVKVQPPCSSQCKPQICVVSGVTVVYAIIVSFSPVNAEFLIPKLSFWVVL